MRISHLWNLCDQHFTESHPDRVQSVVQADVAAFNSDELLATHHTLWAGPARRNPHVATRRLYYGYGALNHLRKPDFKGAITIEVEYGECVVWTWHLWTTVNKEVVNHVAGFRRNRKGHVSTTWNACWVHRIERPIGSNDCLDPERGRINLTELHLNKHMVLNVVDGVTVIPIRILRGPVYQQPANLVSVVW